MVFSELTLTALLYVILGGLYLMIIPAIVYFYLNKRWNVVSSIERTFMYGLVFVFFPGLVLLAPFINLRPSRPSNI